jgi:hypothetical protein
MEWVHGEALNIYIEQNLYNPAALHGLARKWVEVLASLRQSGIAHGDLQHGNILVNHGNIKLIDYDGMFVPALRGFSSHEDGHRNYQHPSRSGKDFGPYLDSFPGWVILVSLSALAVEPRLWRLLNGGDECLLFRRQDFDHAERSTAFQAIIQSQFPEIRALARYLRSLLNMPLGQIPPVDVRSAPQIIVAPGTAGNLPEWVQQNRQHQAMEELPPLEEDSRFGQPGDPAGTEWLVQHLVGTTPTISIWHGVTFVAERIALVVGCAIIGFLALPAAVGRLSLSLFFLLSALLVALEAMFLAIRYRALPSHSASRLAYLELSEAKTHVADAERAIQVLQADIRRLNEPLMALRTRYQQIPQRFRQAVDLCLRKFNAALAENLQLEQDLDAKEGEAIGELDRELEREIMPLLQKKNQGDSQEQQELSNWLVKMREEHILHYLRNRSIADAELHGVGPWLKSRLHSAGILTAADVSYGNVRGVHGIGHAKASVIVGWAKKMRNQAEATAPAKPPAVICQQITVRFQSARHLLEGQIEGLRRRNRANKQCFMDQYGAERRQLRTKRVTIEREHENERRSLNDQYEKEKRHLSDQYKELRKKITEARKAKERKQHAISQELFKMMVDLSKKEQQMKRYMNLSFMRFVLRVGAFGIK